MYEVLIIRYGTRATRRSDVFLNYQLYNEPDGPIRMDYFIWVLRNAARTVVVDTGFSCSGGAARNRTLLVDPRNAFQALDVRPEDAPPVIVTHAHYDHIGNVDYFDRSPIIVAAAEVEFWDGYRDRDLFRHSVDDADLDALAVAGQEERIVVFGDRHHLADGIEVLRVGGHTPGQSMVKVRTAEGDVLLASDAVHYYEEYERDRPFSTAASIVDMYDTYDLVRRSINSGEVAHVLSGHDPTTFDRFPMVDLGISLDVAVIGTNRSASRGAE